MPKSQPYLVGASYQLPSLVDASSVGNRPVLSFGQTKSEIRKDEEVYPYELDSKPVAVEVGLVKPTGSIG